MLLYGVPYIDVRDWRDNTDYKGHYNPKNKVIEWFWTKVETFDQEKLANLLHFCTGSSRTPIQGFKKM
jgi:E3 ubiquitin-protein ligase HUWE1